jgi:dCTP diphosphatase
MTSDENTTIIELKNSIRNFIEERDWSKYHKPKDLAISISIESSELLEIFQWSKDEEIDYQLKESNLIDKIREELSDIMIYCISLSNILNLDLSKAILEKIESNRAKYPVEKVKGAYKKPDEKLNG